MTLAQLFLNLSNHISVTNTEFTEFDEYLFKGIYDLYSVDFNETGLLLKQLIEETYTGGITGLEDIQVDGDTITGVFLDQVSPSVTNKFSFKVTPDDISYRLLTPSDELTPAQFSEWLEFAVPSKPKTTRKSNKDLGGEEVVDRTGRKKYCTPGKTVAWGNRCVSEAFAKGRDYVAPLKSGQKQLQKEIVQRSDQTTKASTKGKTKPTDIKPQGIQDGDTKKTAKPNKPLTKKQQLAQQRVETIAATSKDVFRQLIKLADKGIDSQEAQALLKIEDKLNTLKKDLESGKITTAKEFNKQYKSVGKELTDTLVAIGSRKDRTEGITKKEKTKPTRKQEATRNVKPLLSKKSESIISDKPEIKKIRGNEYEDTRHTIKSQEDFESALYPVLNDLLNKKDRERSTLSIGELRQAIGETLPRDKFNEYLFDLQDKDKISLFGGAPPSDKVEDSLHTDIGGLRAFIKLGDKLDQKELESLAKKNVNKSKQLLKDKQNLDKFGTSKYLGEGSKITDQKEFESVFDEAVTRIAHEFNSVSNQTPVGKIKELLGSRVTSENFDTMLEDMYSRRDDMHLSSDRSKVGIQGRENMSEDSYQRQLSKYPKRDIVVSKTSQEQKPKEDVKLEKGNTETKKPESKLTTSTKTTSSFKTELEKLGHSGLELENLLTQERKANEGKYGKYGKDLLEAIKQDSKSDDYRLGWIDRATEISRIVGDGSKKLTLDKASEMMGYAKEQALYRTGSPVGKFVTGVIADIFDNQSDDVKKLIASGMSSTVGKSKKPPEGDQKAFIERMVAFNKGSTDKPENTEAQKTGSKQPSSPPEVKAMNSDLDDFDPFAAPKSKKTSETNDKDIAEVDPFADIEEPTKRSSPIKSGIQSRSFSIPELSSSQEVVNFAKEAEPFTEKYTQGDGLGGRLYSNLTKKAGLSEGEAAGLSSWLSNGYRDMGRIFRGQGEYTDAEKAPIASALALAKKGLETLPPVTDAKLQERGQPVGKPLNRFIEVEKPEEFIKQYQDSVGKEFTQSGFFGTSAQSGDTETMQMYSTRANVTYSIKAKTDGTGQGRYVDEFKGWSEDFEGEVLYPPDSKFKVKSVSDSLSDNERDTLGQLENEYESGGFNMKNYATLTKLRQKSKKFIIEMEEI